MFKTNKTAKKPVIFEPSFRLKTFFLLRECNSDLEVKSVTDESARCSTRVVPIEELTKHKKFPLVKYPSTSSTK